MNTGKTGLKHTLITVLPNYEYGDSDVIGEFNILCILYTAEEAFVLLCSQQITEFK